MTFTADEIATFHDYAAICGCDLAKVADFLGWDCLDGLIVILLPSNSWHIIEDGESIESGFWDRARGCAF